MYINIYENIINVKSVVDATVTAAAADASWLFLLLYVSSFFN
jgi:hypothetical protein